MSLVSLHGISGRATPELYPLLENWRWLMSKLGKRWVDTSHRRDRDAPWWYNERSSVGFLAGAVWHSRGEAVEEYLADKSYRTRWGRKVRPGRGDIMFTLNPDCRNEQWFVAEAKHLEVDMMNLDVSKVRAVLKQARRESVCSPNYSKATRIGVVFVAPYKRGESQHDSPTVSEIRLWINCLLALQKQSSLTIAWTFPVQTRDLSWHSRSDKAYYFYPGTVMLVKRPRSS